MAIKLNSNAPTSARYHEQALGEIHDLSMIRYNGDVVWQAVAITAPSNLRVNGSTSSTSSACKLTWNAATLSGATGTITYYIYKDGSQVATTTSTSYTFSTSTISGWSGAALTVRAYNSDAGWSGYSNSVTFTFKQGSMYLAESKGWNDATNYYTNATISNSSSVNVGKATSDNHAGIFLKFPVPADWSKVNTMTLHIYRNAGSASGNADIGAPSVDWSGNLAYSSIYNLSSSNCVSPTPTIAAASSWNTIDITGIKDILRANASGGYYTVSMISKGTYMIVDGSLTGNRAYVSVT